MCSKYMQVFFPQQATIYTGETISVHRITLEYTIPVANIVLDYDMSY